MTKVIESKKLSECRVCHEEMIQLWLSDGTTKIYNNHVEGCPNE